MNCYEATKIRLISKVNMIKNLVKKYFERILSLEFLLAYFAPANTDLLLVLPPTTDLKVHGQWKNSPKIRQNIVSSIS